MRNPEYRLDHKPVFFGRQDFHEHEDKPAIILAPVQKQQYLIKELEIPNLATDTVLLKLSMSGPSGDASLSFRTNLIENSEAIFEGTDSHIAFVIVPIYVWTMISPNPNIGFVDFVRSENLRSKSSGRVLVLRPRS